MLPLQVRADRGVHELGYYSSDGCLILVAVNSFGVRVGQERVRTREQYTASLDALTRLLAVVDPLPFLTPSGGSLLIPRALSA